MQRSDMRIHHDTAYCVIHGMEVTRYYFAEDAGIVAPYAVQMLGEHCLISYAKAKKLLIKHARKLSGNQDS